MSRILTVWELGANMGHIDSMLAVARALRKRGHEVTFLVRDLARVNQRVCAEGFQVGQAPLWLPQLTSHRFPFVNYGTVLAAAGWLDVDGLAALMRAWRLWFDLLKSDVLLCDHSPTAMLAARGYNLVRWNIGTSFGVPPGDEYFPPFETTRDDLVSTCREGDEVLLQIVNNALAMLNAPALPRLTSLFSEANQAVLGLPELAHYAGYRSDIHWPGPVFVDDSGVPATWPSVELCDASGPKVFAYLTPTHSDFEPLIRSLTRLGWPTLMHAKGVSAGAAKALRAPNVRFEGQPVKLSDALNQADIVISHASIGTVTATALAGKPQLGLPTHMEQRMFAHRMVGAGIGLASFPGAATNDLQSMLETLATSDTYRIAAGELAQRHCGASAAQTAVRMADLIDASVQQY